MRHWPDEHLLPGALAGERSQLSRGTVLGQSAYDGDTRQCLWRWRDAHAKHRANAIKLIEFLARPEAQQLFVNTNFEYPANPHTPVHPILAKWGTFKHDDINVAAAGELQAAAIKLADRAGYK